MNTRRITLNIRGFNLIEKTASKFGNGAHVVLSKEYKNRLIKIIVGKDFKINQNKIEIDFFGNEILERKASNFGTGFHITVPKEYVGKKIKIIMEKGGKNEK